MPFPFNNAVYARAGNAFERGDPIGYRCDDCGKVVSSMWGYTCNECREKERRHKELIAAIRASGQPVDGGKEW